MATELIQTFKLLDPVITWLICATWRAIGVSEGSRKQSGVIYHTVLSLDPCQNDQFRRSVLLTRRHIHKHSNGMVLGEFAPIMTTPLRRGGSEI